MSIAYTKAEEITCRLKYGTSPRFIVGHDATYGMDFVSYKYGLGAEYARNRHVHQLNSMLAIYGGGVPGSPVMKLLGERIIHYTMQCCMENGELEEADRLRKEEVEKSAILKAFGYTVEDREFMPIRLELFKICLDTCPDEFDKLHLCITRAQKRNKY